MRIPLKIHGLYKKNGYDIHILHVKLHKKSITDYIQFKYIYQTGKIPHTFCYSATGQMAIACCLFATTVGWLKMYYF